MEIQGLGLRRVLAIQWFVGLFTLSLLNPLGATTLDEVYKITLKNNPSFQATQEATQQAQAQRSQLRALAMPTLDLLYSYQRIDPVTNSFGGLLQPRTQTTSRFLIKQPLFQGGAEYAAWERGKAIEELSKIQVQSASRALYREVAQVYYDYWLAVSLYKNGQSAKEASELQVRENQKRVNQGRIPLSVYESSLALQASTTAQVFALKSKVDLARMALYRVSQWQPTPQEDEVFLKELSFALPNLDLRQNESNLQNHPDLRVFQQQLRAEEKTETQTKGSFLPRVDLLGNYYLIRQGPLASSQWDASIQASWSIFNGGLNRSQILESLSKQRQLEKRSLALFQSYRAELLSLVEYLNSQYLVLNQIKKSLEQSKKAYLSSTRESARGQTDSLATLTLLNSYVSAQERFQQNAYDYAIALSKWKTLVGDVPEMF